MAGNPKSLAARARDNSDLATEISGTVAELFQLEHPALMFDHSTRTGNYVMARSLFWYVMVVRWRHSYPELEAITGFNHGTIRSACLVLGESLKDDRELQAKAKVLGV